MVETSVASLSSVTYQNVVQIKDHNTDTNIATTSNNAFVFCFTRVCCFHETSCYSDNCQFIMQLISFLSLSHH